MLEQNRGNQLHFLDIYLFGRLFLLFFFLLKHRFLPLTSLEKTSIHHLPISKNLFQNVPSGCLKRQFDILHSAPYRQNFENVSTPAPLHWFVNAGRACDDDDV